MQSRDDSAERQDSMQEHTFFALSKDGSERTSEFVPPPFEPAAAAAAPGPSNSRSLYEQVPNANDSRANALAQGRLPLFMRIPNSAWVIGLAVLLAASAAIGAFAYSRVSTQRDELSHQLDVLTLANHELSSSLTDLKNQVKSLSSQVEQQSAAPAFSADSPRRSVRASSPQARIQTARAQARAQTPAADPRVARLQNQLADQEKQLASTREELNKTRDELQGKLDSTREELSGSLSSTREELSGNIARTHDEIVALQKRGERNFYEFELLKSKDFRKVGPVSLSLRKANTKRKSFDLALLVDDVQLQKKNVNLYEPVWINLEDRPQPVELVVNEITKDQIRGYIAEPKYRRSELGETTAADRTSRQPKPLEARQ